MKMLYHPNVLPPHIREKLPNPSRPIDEPVVPASIPLFDDKFDPIYQEIVDRLQQKNTTIPNNFPKSATVENVLDFLKNQQKQTPDTHLDLMTFITNIRPLGQSIIKTVIKNLPDFYPNLTKNYLLTTTQFWQNLLALFLLAHCTTRKTLNHNITLKILSQQMNNYLAKNARQIEFLTHDKNIQISPEHVAFAIVALDGKISKKGELGERVTNLSANNFLSKFESL